MPKSACKPFCLKQGVEYFLPIQGGSYISLYHGTMNVYNNVLEALSLAEILNSLSAMFPEVITALASLRLTQKMFMEKGD